MDGATQINGIVKIVVGPSFMMLLVSAQQDTNNVMRVAMTVAHLDPVFSTMVTTGNVGKLGNDHILMLWY